MTRRTLSEAIAEATSLAEQRDRQLLERRARKHAQPRPKTIRRTATANRSTKRGGDYSFLVVERQLS